MSNIPCFTNVKCFHFLHVRIFSFLTFPPHCFPQQTEEMRRPLPHNLRSTVMQHDLLRASPRIKDFLSGSLEFLEFIWERERCGPFSCLGKMVLFTSECSWLQKKRLHCLSPISYIVLNKLKIIWRRNWAFEDATVESAGIHIWHLKNHKSVTNSKRNIFTNLAVGSNL